MSGELVYQRIEIHHSDRVAEQAKLGSAVEAADGDSLDCLDLQLAPVRNAESPVRRNRPSMGFGMGCE